MRSAKLISILLLLAASLSVSGQAVNPAKVKFKGIGLDSTYAQVVKALGSPANEDIAQEEGCIGGKEKTINYAGVSFYMMDGDSKDKKTFEVKSFELTGAEYVVSGIRVGDTQAKVKAVFGRKYTADTDPETAKVTWLYAMNDRDGPGTTRVVFLKGKVLMIASDYQVC